MLWRLRRRAVRLASAQHSAPSPAGAPPGGRKDGGAGGDGRQPGDPGPAVLLDVPPQEAGEAAVGHVLAVWRELTDSAWDYGIEPDDALTPRRAAARIVRIGELDESVGRSVHRVAGAVEQVLFAPEPRAEGGLADEVRKVRGPCASGSAGPRGCVPSWHRVRPSVRSGTSTTAGRPSRRPGRPV